MPPWGSATLSSPCFDIPLTKIMFNAPMTSKAQDGIRYEAFSLQCQHCHFLSRLSVFD